MSFIQATGISFRPFSTSTAFNWGRGASAYDQSWITITESGTQPIASIDGKAISTTSGQNTTLVSRYYYVNHNDFALSGHLYYTSGQSLAESSDEIICVDNSFQLSAGENMDSTVSRTNIIKLEH